MLESGTFWPLCQWFSGYYDYDGGLITKSLIDIIHVTTMVVFMKLIAMAMGGTKLTGETVIAL